MEIELLGEIGVLDHEGVLKDQNLKGYNNFRINIILILGCLSGDEIWIMELFTSYKCISITERAIAITLLMELEHKPKCRYNN